LFDDTTGPVFSRVDFGEDPGDDKLSWTGEASLVVGLGDDEDADELPVEVFSVGLTDTLNEEGLSVVFAPVSELLKMAVSGGRPVET
jgi:hypothetical protein